jgi:hypothetical protein
LHVWRDESEGSQEFIPDSYSYSARDDIFYQWYGVRNQSVELIMIDDAGRIWQRSPYRVHSAGFYGGSTLDRLKSLSKELTPRNESPFTEMPGGHSYEIYAISPAGVPIGATSVYSEKVYYIGTKAVDFRPIAINVNSMVLGNADGESDPASLVWWPDGHTEATPSDGYPLWLDAQDRIHGYKAPPHVSPKERVVWQKQVDAAGAPLVPTSYERFDYETLELPEGWTTTLKIAPGDTSAQLGTATPTDAGSPRQFLSLLLKMDIAVDSDRNGEIVFGSDRTTEEEPFRFWINDDDDGDGSASEAGDSGTKDHETFGFLDTNAIQSVRDLEDFFRLWIDLPDSIIEAIENDNLQIGLKWANATGSPAVNLFKAVENDGGSLYLTETATAEAQIEGEFDNPVKSEDGDTTVTPETEKCLSPKCSPQMLDHS